LLLAPLCAGLLALAACNGSAVVTLTSTASTDTYLAYRVGLVSVQLEASSGKSGLNILPNPTTVDLATLTNISEVLGAAPVSKGTYKTALVTLDYSSAQIVYDNGSLNGVSLKPVGANGQALGQIQLVVTLDPNAAFSVTSKGASQLAMDFSLAASNLVNLSAGTVTVTPLIAASSAPIDTKQVRIRGPLVSALNSASTTAATSSFTTGIMPFDGTANGAGKLSIVAGDTTAYELNGSVSTGSSGAAQLGGLAPGTLTVAYGTLTTAATTTTTTTNGTTTTAASTNVTFTATEVLAGSSVQGAGFDRVSGVVSARSGNTLTIEDGTLVANDGVVAFIDGTTTVNIGPNTLVTVFGQNAVETNNPLEISVGSVVDVFGVTTSQATGSATLDASAGRVRLDPSTASGLVTLQGTGTLDLNLVSLGGRAVAAFDFIGSGADPAQYVVNTGLLSLANSSPGAPVIATGFPNSFGVTPPNFTASTAASSLLDPTTIAAELTVDWGAGTAAPFVTYDSSAIDLDIHNSGIATRHLIQIGAQSIDVLGLTSDPLISPNPTSSNTVYAIGHAASSTVESFNSYAAFIAQLQAELNGSTLATGVTAVGQYTTSTFSFTATSIAVFLNN
jgi:hypothetical protein